VKYCIPALSFIGILNQAGISKIKKITQFKCCFSVNYESKTPDQKIKVIIFHIYFMKHSLSRILKLSWLFVIIIILADGCKGTVTVVPFNPQNKLLYKEVYNNKDTLYFSYDSKHRLVQVAGNDINGLYKAFKFAYDDNNRLVEGMNEFYAGGAATLTSNTICRIPLK